MAALGAAADDDSFTFTPSDARLVDSLRAKIANQEIPHTVYFRDDDVCSLRPEELVRRHGKPARVNPREAGDGLQYYFFSPAHFVGASRTKRSRIIGGTEKKETWHAETSLKQVEGAVDGFMMVKLSYHVKIGEIVQKPGWLMTEYSFKGAGDTVLCKIYKSPRGPGRSKASSSSSAGKRKAEDDLEGETSSMRQRHENVAAPEFAEHVEESQPEPQIAPATFEFDGSITFTLEELTNFPTGDVHTGFGALTDGEVIAACASGGTVAELIPSTMEEVQPESEVPPASTDDSMTFEELWQLLDTDIVDDGAYLQLPADEILAEEWLKDKETLQHVPLSDF